MRTVEIIEHAAAMAGAARPGEVTNTAKDIWRTELNRVYKEVYDLYPWDEKRFFNFTATTTDGTVVLDQTVDTIRAVRIGNQPLASVEVERVSNISPGNLDDAGVAGNAGNFIYLSPIPVLTQPSAATVIKIVSTDAADTSAASGNVRLEGTVAGVADEEEIAFNAADGTIEQTGSKSFTELTQITKQQTTGRIAIRDSASVELGTIAPWDQMGRYKRIRLVPPVDVLTTVTLQATRAFEALVSDDDSILIPTVEGAITSLLISSIFRSSGDFASAREWQRDAAEKIQIAQNNELEQNARTFQSTPAFGLFGHLGSDSMIGHVGDTSITGIGRTL